MILGSHNSWSYLKPKHWWLRPFAFMAKCQSVDIRQQYLKYNVRCFDLRVSINHGNLSIAHGFMKYDYSESELMDWLLWLNARGDCVVRVLHEVRNKKNSTPENIESFRKFCAKIVRMCPNVKFWCGKNLYTWDYDYEFDYRPSCKEMYSSVSSPKLLDDWFPWLYARLKNSFIRKMDIEEDILLIDFVNIK